MFSLDAKACSLKAMYITGIILVPVVMASPTAIAPSDGIPSPTSIASPASDDLSNLMTIINTAADSISAMANHNTGWNLFGGGDSQMGTADLVNNITATILRSKFQLDTNKTSWLLPTQSVDAENPQLNNAAPSPWTPTLPLSSSLSLPSVLPTSTPTLVPATPELSTPYIDYVSSVANLSANLISRGRTWHREMNAPVHEAIDALQQSISILQSGLLQSELINSQAVIRTIRASSTLEDAQQAWSRFLNLPGPGGNTNGDDVGTVPDSPSATTRSVVKKRETRPAFTPTVTRLYTHQELWGRKEGAKMRQSNSYDRVVGKDQHARNNGERPRAFTA